MNAVSLCSIFSARCTDYLGHSRKHHSLDQSISSVVSCPSHERCVAIDVGGCEPNEPQGSVEDHVFEFFPRAKNSLPPQVVGALKHARWQWGARARASASASECEREEV